ncbi:MAG: CoA pyrophosphatase [Gemmatimonadota bacterium]|nr:CoA pyrophosphatase [Gemmatimonadota bacterium]
MTEQLEIVKQKLGKRVPKRVVEDGSSEAAVAVIVAPRDCGDMDLLFIRRAEHERDPWSGHMALPGGRRDSQDETLLDTARRETMEEVGIALPKQALLGELDDLHPRVQALPNIVVRPFVFGLPERQAVRPSHEVALHVWIGLERLRASRGLAELEVRGNRISVDAFLIDDHVIWGMTHRILMPFLDLV